MDGPTSALVVALLWLVVAVVVLGYPLATGRMRAGTETVYRDGDPQQFWTTYAVSSGVFLLVSAAIAYVLSQLA
ncbi:MAG: hypothetical protein K1X94_26510 [Sandaracinaceae bacterium]|nr:hypothetical protein [Sandaracinaceae bacterium]